MASHSSIVASFVESAPPGELSNVVADIKTLAPKEASSLGPAFRKYNEEQYTTVKLSKSGEAAIISPYNRLGDDRYFDTIRQVSFRVDHSSQTATDEEAYETSTQHAETVRSLHKTLSAASAEHFPSSAIGIYPSESSIVVVLVANKYSPQNFWNGRWRSTYTIDPSSNTVTGTIKVDVHYYEDGNVRMSTSKKVDASGNGPEAVVREIVKAENKYEEELNRAFTTLAEGSFKGLRRQLPVTRQRVEWEKVGGYRIGQDIGGGRSK